MKKLATILVMTLMLAACGSEGGPPDDGSPYPQPLNGTFKSQYGTLTFNGDGRSIVIDTDEEFEKLTEIPAGKHEGTCVFLFQNGEWRYDFADEFRVTIGEESWTLHNDFTNTDEDTVAISAYGGEVVKFEKVSDQEAESDTSETGTETENVAEEGEP